MLSGFLIFAQKLWQKGPLEIRLVIIYRPSRRRWYRFIRLCNLRPRLQPKP